MDTPNSLRQGTINGKPTMQELRRILATSKTIAVVGLYGAISYAVSQRTREMGIRVALGATSREVLGIVLGDAMSLNR